MEPVIPQQCLEAQGALGPHTAQAWGGQAGRAWGQQHHCRSASHQGKRPPCVGPQAPDLRKCGVRREPHPGLLTLESCRAPCTAAEGEEYGQESGSGRRIPALLLLSTHCHPGPLAFSPQACFRLCKELGSGDQSPSESQCTGEWAHTAATGLQGISGDLSGCHSRESGAPDIQCVKAEGASQHPTVHRTAPQQGEGLPACAQR